MVFGLFDNPREMNDQIQRYRHIIEQAWSERELTDISSLSLLLPSQHAAFLKGMYRLNRSDIYKTITFLKKVLNMLNLTLFLLC